MSGKDEGFGLFRRMARRVAAPARDLVGLTAPAAETDARPTEFDKAEMKAMIERKRRNDYVRKRELDTLRRIRREGLSAEQAQSLTLQSSRIDENESRSTQSSSQGNGIKAKIDAIERQMVGANAGVSAGGPASRTPRPAPSPSGPPPPILTTTIFDSDERDSAPTVPVPLTVNDERAPRARAGGAEGPPSVPGVPLPSGVALTSPASLPPLEFSPSIAFPPAPAPAPAPPRGGAPAAGRPATVAAAGQGMVDLGGGERVEVSEAVHDEALDEAVISFAGGDFQTCERVMQSLVGVRGLRRDHEDTWLVLFDLYRAVGQQTKFDALTIEYVDRFHRSAPQWFSLPNLLAKSATAPTAGIPSGAGAGWICPPRLDIDAVQQLEALSMQLPAPWIMDWSHLASIDVEGAGRLNRLFEGWASQSLNMHWLVGERLFSVLQELAPTGVRDVDPVFWMLRLAALRLAHRPDQFDEVAIDYCVTYEVSPPSWENARCQARMMSGNPNTRSMPMSVVSDAVTSFLDTATVGLLETRSAPVQVASLELAGQLAGDQSELIARLTHQIGTARVIRLSCALLLRVDFVAAGDLLNWVAGCHAQGREVLFFDVHRLVALMFGAMGIQDCARVQLRAD